MLLAAPANAQPDFRVPPLVDGRLLVGGDLAATAAPEDTGYFNYTDYDHSLLRLFAATASAEFRLHDRVRAVGEIRLENVEALRASAWYIRLRPLASVPLDVQAGKIPPVFGGFTRRRYGRDNPLVGTPLAYQYLTTARSDAIPPNADSLLRVRGRGWLVGGGYVPAGLDAGLPLVSAFRYDTGVSVRWNGDGRVEGSVAFTVGSLSTPTMDDGNHGVQFAGRIVWRPVPAFAVGMSGSRAPYLSGDLSEVTPSPVRGYGQRAVGLDVEVSSGHWLLRGEVLGNWWDVPALSAPRLDEALQVVTGFVEGRYRFRPRWHVAARAEHMTFSRIQGTLFGGTPTTWDAPVTRLEGGLGFAVTRQLMLKAAYQHNWRDGGRVRSLGLPAVQLSFWF